ncbi:MAG: hypothetical protein IJO09_09700 [Oscillospiraceae bacterium]|nr:hypothetical protein [Oscillospiraceae bacterium]
MYLMLVLYCALTVGGTVLMKIFQKTTSSGMFYLIMYNIINALFACGFFFVSAGFKINLNLPTIIYAVVYALIICINLSAQIVAFSKVSVSVVTVVSMAGGILFPSIFGIMWFDDNITWQLVVSSILIIAASILPFVSKNEDKNEKKRFSLAAMLICFMMSVLAGVSTILVKLYAVDTSVCDSTSMFFLTNVAIVVICFVALAIYMIRNKNYGFKEVFRAFSPIQLLNIVSKTAVVNVASIVQVLVLAEMSASTFSVLSSSICLVGTGLASALIFREKQTKGAIFAMILALVAIIINP